MEWVKKCVLPPVLEDKVDEHLAALKGKLDLRLQHNNRELRTRLDKLTGQLAKPESKLTNPELAIKD